MLKAAFSSYKVVVKNFFGNQEYNKYEEFVRNMLENLRILRIKMSIGASELSPQSFRLFF